MDFFQTITLALVQGLSEFLPISSSAHLILVPKITDWPDQGLAFDVVVHLGTLTAVVYYYQDTLKAMSNDFYRSIIKCQSVGESKLAWGVLLGTIPVGIFGLLFKDSITLNFRSLEVIAYTTLIFGILLGVASWFNTRNPNPRISINWFDVLFIGTMQALALIPGTSRSGITITAGLLIGLSRQMSIQFAFLLSIPVIAIASASILIELYGQPQVVNISLLFLGFVVSALSSYFTIVFFIKLLDRVGMMPFVVYRLLLGMYLLTL
jgi:undecaprenyl-diphosphatase